ncbi:MAG: HNH endonuclease [Candidatus Contendobacter sp.]|jgi:hypothetical protein|nr:HNH endonuclease [Candidatus Contendobacter sp.]
MTSEIIPFTEKEMQTEIWKPVAVDGFGHLYEVSNLGRVRRMTDSCYHASWKKGKVLAQVLQRPYGHIKIELYNQNNRKSIWLHRLVLLTFVGKQPTDKHECAHIDGNACNNRLLNLRWATSAENKEDARKHGTMVVGSIHPNAKLNESTIQEILNLRTNGLTQKAIGDRYGVHRVTIGKILQRRRWKHA